MIPRKEYEKFVSTIEDAMTRARVLGMFRTEERLHGALQEARSEMFEAMPKNVPTVVIRIGPVSNQ